MGYKLALRDGINNNVSDDMVWRIMTYFDFFKTVGGMYPSGSESNAESKVLGDTSKPRYFAR